MQGKLYLLLAVLFVFVICSTSVDEKPEKDDFITDLKKKMADYGKDDNRDKDKSKDQYKDKDKYEDNDERVDDALLSSGSYANNRYSSNNSPSSNYRPRSRWSGQSAAAAASSLASQYDDSTSDNDWPRSGYGNSFPGNSPSMFFDNDGLLGNGRSCNSLVDSQYPIFSDTCGAVPQARYVLPNSFGHRERWHVAQALTTLMNSVTDPTCTRSLRLLLCPILFPPCPSRNEPSPVLPCQSYCRAVKARCSMPVLDRLPCEVLPYSSDFCPTNQHYGSFLPSGPFSSGPQTYPMPGGPTSRSLPSLQSLLSLAGLQSPLTSFPPTFNSPQSLSSLNPYNSGPYGTDSLSSMMNDFSSRSMMNDFPSRSMMNDFPSRSMMNDFPPRSMMNDFPSRSMMNDFPSRSYTNDYRQQASKYSPYTRSSTDTRATNELRTANEARPAAARSSVVKA